MTHTEHKRNSALLLGAAAVSAAAYSYLPSMAGKAIHKIKRKKETEYLYLTFDDGPDSVYTEKLLDLLAEYQIKATFFVVGAFAKESPHIIQRMQAEGHLIGLHSLSHKSAMIQSPWYTENEFAANLSILKELGVQTEYYRPPWGHVNLWTLRCLKKYRLKKVLWDVMAQDWQEEISEEEIQYRLLKRTGGGDIICLHDGRGKNEAPARMLAALEKTLPIWLEEGYQFKRIDER
ncbi:MAG: polysaccharide deacetylase family protein [Emergencia sp.]|nr:polysaccharide deacetylase family protein [Emergencia sp.]